MTSFSALYKLAAANRGGTELLEAILPRPKTAAQLAEQPDSRYLSMMSRCIFRAGFVWRVIDNKWSGFETAFAEFNPLAVAHFSDEKLEALAQDKSIVRNFTKIVAVRNNAVYVLDRQRSHGSFAEFIAHWPEDNITGLWLEMKKQGSRLGGNTGPMMLRSMGRDTFLLTKDVCDALINHGFMKKFSPTSQRDLKLVEQVFEDLRAESGRPLCQISRILSCTV
ncbi:MAG: DNA-3-methyladenine glycosylase I [Porticoccaceae bacterium]|jgi:3-methyladenine DNA glycosylase Tag|nr:DNA-3-methyladenine glycosylase I [Porticoccaceae bacterium]MBT5577529.1 DNA-3-methyladenine glycosylase I [Porticoccaceae bacterium]MBT7375921.1 DNA-3-methyladenine glycosylase I [Porticoccaceae bacterium]